MTLSPDDGRAKLLNGAVWQKATSPKIDDTKLFLADGVKLAGRALHGAEWTSEEVYSPSIILHPDEVLRRAKEMQERAEQDFRLGISRMPTERFNAPMASQLPAVEGGPAEWRAALLKIWEAEPAVRKRLLDTIEWISDHARNKRLKGYLRKKEGGAPIGMQADFWYRDDLVEKVFASCDYSKGKERYWIFLDRSEFEALLSALPGASLTLATSDLASFSPLLKMAVHLAQKWKADASWKPPINKTLKWEIQKEWRAVHGTDLPPSSAEYIMYVLKHPEPEKASDE